MKKRVMSLLLAVCLLLSLCPAGMEIAVGGAGAAAGITFTAVQRYRGHYSEYDEERMFDGDASTEWMFPWRSMYVDFAASERVVLTGYTLVASQNSDLFQARQPYRLELQGRNDPDGDWTVLDTVTNTSNRVYANGETLHYDIPDNTAYYRYYRIWFHRDPVDGTATGVSGVFAFAELQPQYTACAHDWVTTSTVDATCTAPSHTYQYCSVCRDERTLTGTVADPLGHDLDADGVCRHCHRQNPVVVGPFVISGKNLVEGVDYQLGGISDSTAAELNPTGLYILSDKDITIENADKAQEICEYQIVLLNNGAVNVTLGGVNLNLKNSNIWAASTHAALLVATKNDRAIIMAMLNGDGNSENGWNVDWDAVEAEDWSDRVVTLTLEAGSNNVLTGATEGAGLGKSEARAISGQLIINGTGCLTAKAHNAAGIGSATMAGDTGDITITGGCTVVAHADGAAIGGGNSSNNVTNITIENSTVSALEAGGSAGIGSHFGTVNNIRLIGGSIKGGVIGGMPTDANGQPVYLAVIPNPNGEAVTINGQRCTTVDHTAADPTDTNLYIYLTDPTEVKHIQVGEKEFHYHFDSAQNVFRSYLQDAYAVDDTAHWQACSYPGCTETEQREVHDHNTFAKDATQYWKECVCGHKVEHKPLPTVTVNFPQIVCDGSAIPFTVTTTDGATVLAEESTFTGDNATFLAMLPTEESTGSTQPFRLCMKWNGTLDNWCAHLKVQTTDGFAYTVDRPVTVTDVRTSHVDNDDHLCDVCGTEVSTHTGGTATCKAQATCTICGQPYGNLDENHHVDSEAVWIKTATTHEKVWECCDAVAVAEAPHDWENGECKDCGYEALHTVTFDTGVGGSAIAPRTGVKWRDKVLGDQGVPTKDGGWVFHEWRYGTTPVTAEMTYGSLVGNVPTDGITLTAAWTDVQAPTGEIAVGTNRWRAFLHTITFGLFFKNTQEVTITAADNSGEPVAVEYFVSRTAVAEAAIAAQTFTPYTAPVRLAPDGEYVVYAKLTDATGNVAYISSNGVVLDAVAPTITGLTEGETYCAAPTVTVTDGYAVTVTVNGEPVTLNAAGQFVLAPAAGEQTVVATDAAGNETRVCVTVNDGHTGGTATCQAAAECTECGESYGDVDATNHVDSEATWTKTATMHERVWKCCDVVAVAKAPHDWENGACKDCEYVCAHTGGTATCQAAAECTECGESYGDVDATNHVDSEATWTKTATTHEKVWKCCDAIDVAEAPHDWENGVCKDCEYVCTHTGGTATCQAAAECTECGESYGDVDATNHVDSEATWTKTATTHEKVWKCCDVVAVAKAPHDWENGACKDCEYVCAHTGGTATCQAAAVCSLCAETYGTTDVAHHAALTHVAAVAATTESEGRREHWHCADCARDFLDAAGTREATAADLVTAKLPVPLVTGEGAYTVLWTVLALSGGTLLVTVLGGTRRRRRTTGKH